jgi:L-rhamnose mutarotase
MNRVEVLLKITADKLEEHKQHHTAGWPETLDALRRTLKIFPARMPLRIW